MFMHKNPMSDVKNKINKINRPSKYEPIIILTIVLFICFIVFGSKDTIEVIDGCEYIHHFDGRGFNLTHKGNCTNKIHIYNK